MTWFEPKGIPKGSSSIKAFIVLSAQVYTRSEPAEDQIIWWFIRHVELLLGIKQPSL